jgi:aspartate racemase
MADATPLLGVLGGMGPLAAVDLLKKLIEETPAKGDADHVPVILYSVPQIPDRPAAILENGPSPLPAMLTGVRQLKRGGATLIAIACNTAHYWYEELAAEGVPILHIADASCDELLAYQPGVKRVGLIATKGTVAARFFQDRFAARGIECIVSTDEEQDLLVLPSIVAVKTHALDEAHRLAIEACERLRARGAEAIVLGCTEMPVAVEHAHHPIRELCVDPTRALAKACARWWQERK